MAIVPSFPASVPWFMLDLDNWQLITSPTIPGDIRDTKEVVLAEQQVPGLNYRPVMPGGGGNRRLSFSLQLVRRNNTVGNVFLLQQFERLRNRATGRFGWSGSRFAPMPKVLYYWGTGSVPLVYWVARANATHRQGWVNQFGSPQVSEVEIELVLDEEHPIYRAEELFRATASVAGEALPGFDAEQSILATGRPD